MAHLDVGDRRESLFENFLRELGELRDIAQVGEKNSHGHDIVEAPACFGQGDADLVERRFELRFEIAQIGIRPRLARGMAGEKKHRAAFDFDRRRARVLRLRLDEFFLQLLRQTHAREAQDEERQYQFINIHSSLITPKLHYSNAPTFYYLSTAIAWISIIAPGVLSLRASMNALDG